MRKVKPAPTLTRRARAAANRLEQQVRRRAEALGIDVQPTLVGSLAKDTHLVPAPDIDVFLLFDPATPRPILEKQGLRLGRSVVRTPTLKYAEHPYVHGRFGGFAFDVVPAYRVLDGAARVSAVDRSPFHTRYVKDHLRAAQRDEVRLLKAFLKGIGCYGAETSTSGFSGYLAELLVIRFGTFWDALAGTRDLKPPLALAIAGGPRPMGGDFVFVDPVDPRRNAAAAVSRDRLDTFLRAARAFTLAPRREFFEPRPRRALSREELEARFESLGVLGLRLPRPSVRPDARLPHLRRLADKIGGQLEDDGFRVPRRAVEPVPGGFLILWQHEPLVLPDTYEHRGPRVDDAANARRFLQKWQAHPDAVSLPHAEGERWVVAVRRTARDPARLLGPRLHGLLEGTDVPAAAARRARFEAGTMVSRRAAFRLALTRFVDPKDPWEA